MIRIITLNRAFTICIKSLKFARKQIFYEKIFKIYIIVYIKGGDKNGLCKF